ncbi:DUF1616 domain-containing protein [Winogradskya humida]|uniref:DUF1616 domain-containing protein n=1 Tax=Winogradskya humida TaxID=113566 RepID=A0ABQ4A0E3_9ACTN|nr:DUF1616 domain-containing protein [Actinoplanes humidus]GIE24068.1 hypothetical protein Ahu01nite_071700 [Actinoplanes humidus]
MNALLTRIVWAATTLSALAVLLGPQPLPIIGGLLLGLVLPGTALTGALLRDRTLTVVERVTLAPALSMAVLVVAGLVIYLCRLPLDRVTWTAATAGVTIAALIAALIPSRSPANSRGVPGSAGPDAGSSGRAASDRGSSGPDSSGPDSSGPDSSGSGSSGSGPSGPGLSGSTSSGLASSGLASSGLASSGAASSAAAASGPAGGGAAGDSPRPRVAAAEPTMTEAHTIVMQVVPPTTEERLAAEYKMKRNRLIKQSLPLLLVAAILGGASWLSFHTSRETYKTTVTALSAEPAGAVASDGNRTVVVSASGLLDEDAPYKVTVNPVAASTKASRTITASAAGTWRETLTIPGDERVTISLYRSGDTTAYRTISISASS